MAAVNVTHTDVGRAKAPGENSHDCVAKSAATCYRATHKKARALTASVKHLLKNGVLFVLRKIKKRNLVKVPPNPLQRTTSFGYVLRFFSYMAQSKGLRFCKKEYTETMTGPKRRRGPNKKTMSNNAKVATVAEDSIQEVFNYWVLVHKSESRRKPALDSDRRFFIALAIHDYGIQECKEAIDGCRLSDFHMGRNKQGKKYNDIKLILRGAEQIERFLDLYDKNYEPDGDPF